MTSRRGAECFDKAACLRRKGAAFQPNDSVDTLWKILFHRNDLEALAARQANVHHDRNGFGATVTTQYRNSSPGSADSHSPGFDVRPYKLGLLGGEFGIDGPHLRWNRFSASVPLQERIQGPLSRAVDQQEGRGQQLSILGSHLMQNGPHSNLRRRRRQRQWRCPEIQGDFCREYGHDHLDDERNRNQPRHET